jgi:diphosphomevalonate decarboxylase
VAKARDREATYEASPNIALVKYWGSRDRSRALPYSSSISVTLNRLRSRTSVRFKPDLQEDQVSLNGEPAGGGPRTGVVTFLDRVRALAGVEDRAQVRSDNNFATASGLASSASGFAALAGASMAALGLRFSPRQLARLARFGAGSASRSIFGGFVEWHAGSRPDGRDCFTRPLWGPNHWPELVDVVATVKDAPEKTLRSADAMQLTVATSPRYQRRLDELGARTRRIRAALRARDPNRLFPLIMEECDDFREVCESTNPKLDYLTRTSRDVLEEVRSINRSFGRPVAAYTHDAGAHVHVFTLTRHRSKVARRVAAVPGLERVLSLRPGRGGRRIR